MGKIIMTKKKNKFAAVTSCSVVNSPAFIENWGKIMVSVGMYSGRALPLLNLIWTSIHLVFPIYTAYHAIAIDFDFGLFSSECFYVIMMSSICSSIVNCQMKSVHLEDMVRIIERDFHDYGGTIDPQTDALVKADCLEMKKRKKTRATFVFLFVAVSAVCSAFVFPIIFGEPEDRGDNIHRNIPVVTWYPVSTQTWPGFLYLLFVEYWIFFVVVMTAIGTDVPFICYTEEGIFQFNRLGFALTHTLRRARFVYKRRHGKEVVSNDDPRFEACLRLCFQHAVQHHYCIIRYFDDLSKLYFIILLVIILAGTFLLCISAILFVSDNVSLKPKLQFMCYLLSIIVYIFNFSWYGEAISQRSTMLCDDLYRSNWQDCNKAVRQYLLIMQSYMMKPTVITASGFMPLNLIVFRNVLSSAFSYFNLLNMVMTRGENG